MPTYEYACKSCGERLEIQQRFTDDALTECPSCGGPLRKVFGSVGIAFKGSGFYKTDSRGSKSSTTASKPSEAASGDSSSSSSEKSEKTSSEKPAASPPSTPSTAAAG